jgi:hypothetical protein
VVLVDMIVETSWLIWVKVGESILRRSAAILFRAVLSRTTLVSASCFGEIEAGLV